MKRKLFVIYMVLCTLTYFCVSAEALGMVAGLEVEEIQEDQTQKHISNTEMLLLSAEVTDTAIACFDVSPNGLIAIGFDTNPKTVNVYDQTGRYIYGYQFNCEGSYGIAFEGDNLAIYFSRAELVEVYDSAGQGISAHKVLRTSSNNKREQELIYPIEKQLGDQIYRLERDFGIFARSYSRLVSVGDYSKETVVYNATLSHNIGTTFVGVVIVCFFVLSIRAAIKQEIRKEQSGE